MESTTRSANQDSAKATTVNQPGGSGAQAGRGGDANSASNSGAGSGGGTAARPAVAAAAGPAAGPAGGPGLATRTVDITGMTGDACVQKVAGALKEVPGVEVQTVKVGSATIRCDQAGYSAACAAIARAGYKPQSVSGPVDGAADPHDANSTGEHAGERAGELAGRTAGRTAGQAGGGGATDARKGESSRGDSRNTSAGGGQPVTQPNPPHTQNPRHAGNDRANGPRPVMPGVHGDEGDTVQRTDAARKADPAAGTATK